MSEFARSLQANHDPEQLLQHIVDTAVRDIDGADHAGISLLQDGELSTVAPTSDLVARVDRLQYEFLEGPCVQAARAEQTVRSDDLADDPRWPRFAAGAVEAGVRSMLSVQLFVESNSLGALNTYSRSPGAFDSEDENVALVLAAHAAVAMAAQRKQTNLEIALHTRDVIGQAKGVLMERYKIDQRQAFQLLILSSQQTHLKLRDVAEQLTTSGELAVPGSRSR